MIRIIDTNFFLRINFPVMRTLMWLIALLVMLPLTSQATNYTYSATVDLSGATIQNGGGQASLIYSFPSIQSGFDLGVGDTLSGTISFDQAIAISSTGPSTLFPTLTFSLEASPQVATNNSSSATVQLNGVTGNLASANPGNSTSSGGAFTVYYGGESTGSLAFTGFNYQLTVTSTNASGVAYVPDQLAVQSNFSQIALEASPEPPVSWLVGFGSVGFAVCGLLSGSVRHSSTTNVSG